MTTNNTTSVGIDIGTTTTKVSYRDADGAWCTAKVPTNYTDIATLTATLGLASARVGCAIPAPVKNGRLAAAAPNLTTLPTIPAGTPLLNDGNAAAFGEYIARDLTHQSLFMASIGTGLGGGFISHGTIFEGANGFFAEAGHFTLMSGGKPCNCGARGCAEGYTSSQFFAPHNDQATIAHHFAEQTTLFQEFLHHIAAMLGSITNLYDPDIIVIGGGLGSLLRPHYKQLCYLTAQQMFRGRPLPAIEPSTLGEFAAARGMVAHIERLARDPFAL